MNEYNTDNYTWTWAGIEIDREQFLALAPSFTNTDNPLSRFSPIPKEVKPEPEWRKIFKTGGYCPSYGHSVPKEESDYCLRVWSPKKGSQVNVKWPDGQVTTETVRLELSEQSWSDHNNRGSSDYYRPYFEVEVRGAKARMYFDGNDLEVFV